MNEKLIAMALTAAFSVPPAAIAAEQAPEHSFSGNLTLASEYLYRGIAQTRGKPAIQGGFDYAHKSGLYAGLWASDITYYKLGVTKDLGVGVLGVAYSTTNAKDSCSGNAPASVSDVYCLVKSDGKSAYEAGKSRLLVTFGKTF